MHRAQLLSVVQPITKCPLTSGDLDVLIDKFVDDDGECQRNGQAIARVSRMSHNEDGPMPEVQPVRSATDFDE